MAYRPYYILQYNSELYVSHDGTLPKCKQMILLHLELYANICLEEWHCFLYNICRDSSLLQIDVDTSLKNVLRNVQMSIQLDNLRKYEEKVKLNEVKKNILVREAIELNNELSTVESKNQECLTTLQELEKLKKSFGVEIEKIKSQDTASMIAKLQEELKNAKMENMSAKMKKDSSLKALSNLRVRFYLFSKFI